VRRTAALGCSATESDLASIVYAGASDKRAAAVLAADLGLAPLTNVLSGNVGTSTVCRKSQITGCGSMGRWFDVSRGSHCSSQAASTTFSVVDHVRVLQEVGNRFSPRVPARAERQRLVLG
jgi:hypothetical protein